MAFKTLKTKREAISLAALGEEIAVRAVAITPQQKFAYPLHFFGLR